MSAVLEERLPIPDRVPVLLRDIIHERLGTFFDDSRFDMMLDKLEAPARERNCKSMLDYYYLLKYDSNGQHEWARVMDALSVQETYFWREMSQIEVLTNLLVPQWFKQRSYPLRIWSAACASGEEPYSIAMALQEAGLGDRPIDIVGSDASPAALIKARQGLFRERSFRVLPAGLREKYFTADGNGWRICNEIKARVQFHRANLVAPEEIEQLATAPVIFCRNVFIYFSTQAIQRTVKALATSMPDKSFLFTGSSESLVNLATDFELEEIQDAFVYIRRPRKAGS